MYLAILYHPNRSFAHTCSARDTVGERVLTSLIGRRDKKEKRKWRRKRGFFFASKGHFFFYRRNDTPTHEQSSDIIVAKSKGFFHHSTTFHSTFHLFRLITRIYEFLSQENDLAKRIPRLYTAWIPGRRIRLCLFTDTDEGRRMKKNGGAG